MLVNFNMIFDEVQGANHSHSRRYGEDLQRRNSQKDIKIIDNLSVVGVLVGGYGFGLGLSRLAGRFSHLAQVGDQHI